MNADSSASITISETERLDFRLEEKSSNYILNADSSASLTTSLAEKTDVRGLF